MVVQEVMTSWDHVRTSNLGSDDSQEASLSQMGVLMEERWETGFTAASSDTA